MQPDTSTRLRLVEVRTPGGDLRLDGGFAGVLAAPAARSAAARWIATAVAGPRPAGADGTIEIAGRFVSVRSLPSPLLAPSAPSVIGREVLRAQWQVAWAARRDDLAAAHSSRRLARHRAEAALERARRRAEGLAARVETLGPPPGARVPAERVAAPVVTSAPPASLSTPDPADMAARTAIASMLAALDDLAATPSPAALALAEEWDQRRAGLAAQESRASGDNDVERDLADAEARVAAARVALALASGGIDPIARAHIDELHRTVVDAEAAVSEAKRKDRADALMRYEHAVRAERAALEFAGIDSYASMLMAIAQGAMPPDPTAREHAAAELREAQAQLAEVHERLGPAVLIEDIESELRSRAAQILGRLPAPDVSADLRAYRIEHPDADAVRGFMVEALTSVDVPAGGDVVAAARAYLARPVRRSEAQPEIAPISRVELSNVEAERRSLVDEHSTLHEEVLALIRTRDEHAVALDALELELGRLDTLRIADLHELGPDDIGLAVGALLDAYRRGDLLAGRLPLVLDGALDGIDRPARKAAVATLAAATDVQSIVVSDDPSVVDAIRDAGGVVCTWPEPSSSPLPAPRPVGTPRTVSSEPVAPVRPAPVAERCVTHAEATSVARCARCVRPSCIDCLVYVIGEPELWCAACATETHGARNRNLRLLRRRGA
ncbi:MAG: hypothetical protein ACT4OX_04640 [Actinomycetota bacterium]